MIAATDSNVFIGIFCLILLTIIVITGWSDFTSEEKEDEKIDDVEDKSIGAGEVTKDKIEVADPLTQTIVPKDTTVKIEEDDALFSELILKRLTSIDSTLNMIKWPVFLACIYFLRELFKSQ